MRICVIPPDQHYPHPDHILSGQEKVARDQARILTELGHEVDFWTIDVAFDMSHLGFRHRIMTGIKPRSLHKAQQPQLREKREWCKTYGMQYDIFIIHTDSGVFLKELVKLGLGPRIISFIHAPFAGTLWGLSFNSAQGRARWAGSTLVAVSARCQNHWNKWSSSMLKRMRDGDIGYIDRPDLINTDVFHEEMITDVISPQYSTITSPVLPATENPIILSRISPEKSIHQCFGLAATFVVRNDNEKYWLKIKSQLLLENHFINLAHAECMDKVSGASVLISTWSDETSGINAFEAAERGVPVILCEDGPPHASRDFLPDWAYVTCKPNQQSIRLALENLPSEWSTLAFRQKLAEYMRKNWDQHAYASRLSTLVNRVFCETQGQKPIPKHFSSAPKVKDPIDPQLMHIMENVALKTQTKFAWIYRMGGGPLEINFRIFDTPLGNKSGVYAMILSAQDKRKPVTPISIGEGVIVQVMALKMPRFETGAVGREWNRWQCLWVSEELEFTEEGLISSIKNGVQFCKNLGISV